jgi:arylsulfatase A-like enzyme
LNNQVQNNPHFAAMVEGVDTSVGRIISKLGEKALLENTVVIFTSDNGGLSTESSTSNLPLRAGKGWLYEGGIRVPAIMRWPSVIQPGTISKAPIFSTDFYPTFLAIAGIALRPKDHVDGVDLLPLLRDGTRPKRETYFWHYPHIHGAGNRPSGAILCGKYKLIQYYGTEIVELYNIEGDLSERQDLSESMPEKRQELLANLRAWQKSFPDISYYVPKAKKKKKRKP